MAEHPAVSEQRKRKLKAAKRQTPGLLAFVADETGLLKEVTATESKPAVRRFRAQDRTKAIQDMCFAPTAVGELEKEILIGTAAGAVERLDVETGETEVEFEDGADSTFVGMHAFDRMLITCGESGEVRYRSRDDAGAAQTVIKTLPQVNKMRVCSEKPGWFVVGGDKSDLRIYDVNNAATPIFKARNVKPDKLQLEQPKCINDVAFVPGSDGTRIVTGTKYREFRLYDTKVKARPIINNVVSEYAIKSIAMHPNGNEVILADVAGLMFSIDLRTMRNCGSFRGNSGSVRSIEVHPTLPLVAAVGLDRHLRVYNANTKRGVTSVYLKQRLNKVLLSSDSQVGIEIDEELLAAEQREAEEEEALWANLEGGITNKKAKVDGNDDVDAKEGGDAADVNSEDGAGDGNEGEKGPAAEEEPEEEEEEEKKEPQTKKPTKKKGAAGKKKKKKKAAEKNK